MGSLSLAGFKKLKENDKTVTMTHPKGHSITVLKSKISPIQREQIKRLPMHLAVGGEAEDTGDSQATSPESQPATSDTSGNPFLPSPGQVAGNLIDAGKNAISQTSASQLLGVAPAEDNSSPAPTAVLASNDRDAGIESAVNPPNPAQQQVAPSSQIQDGTVDISKAYQQGQGAIGEQEKVAEQLAAKRAEIEQEDIDARKTLQTNVDQNLKDFSQHQQDFANYVQANPINPNHYQENMGTGQKVATAIGLLLGGFTGGFNKTGVNPASDWLNGQINRDIEGQKARMDQQKTILGANQELYHDQVLATNATRLNMLDLYDHKLQLAAAQLGTPAAKAAADAQHANYALEKANIVQSMAIRGGILQQIRQNGGKGLTPIALGHGNFMSPEEAQKEQASLDKQNQSIATAKDIFSKLSSEDTTLNLANPQSYLRKNALVAQLLPLIQSEDPSSRLTEEALKQELKPFITGTFSDETTSASKLQGVLNLVKQRHSGETPNLGQIAPAALPNYNVLSPQQQATQWARANPNDPRSEKILQKLGVVTNSKIAR